MSTKLANSIDFGPLRGQGELGFENVPDRPFLVQDFVFPFTNIISITIGVLTLVAFIWFLFKLITGAIGILGSGGDKGKVAEGRANITYGIVGIIIVISAMFIAGLVGLILGVDFFDLYTIIANIR